MLVLLHLILRVVVGLGHRFVVILSLDGPLVIILVASDLSPAGTPATNATRRHGERAANSTGNTGRRAVVATVRLHATANARCIARSRARPGCVEAGSLSSSAAKRRGP